MRLDRFLNGVYFLIILTVLILAQMEILRQVLEIKTRKETTYLLPDKSACALKLMILRDGDNQPRPVDRMVCHWNME